MGDIKNFILKPNKLKGTINQLQLVGKDNVISKIIKKEDIVFASIAAVAIENNRDSDHYGEKILEGTDTTVGYMEGDFFISIDNRRVPILKINDKTYQYSFRDKDIGSTYAIDLYSYNKGKGQEINIFEAKADIAKKYKKLVENLNGVCYSEFIEDKIIKKQDIILASIIEVIIERDKDSDHFGEKIFSSKNTTVGYMYDGVFICEDEKEIPLLEQDDNTQCYSFKDKKVNDSYAIYVGSFYKGNEQKIKVSEAKKIIHAINNEMLKGTTIGIQYDSNGQNKVK